MIKIYLLLPIINVMSLENFNLNDINIAKGKVNKVAVKLGILDSDATKKEKKKVTEKKVIKKLNKSLDKNIIESIVLDSSGNVINVKKNKNKDPNEEVQIKVKKKGKIKLLSTTFKTKKIKLMDKRFNRVNSNYVVKNKINNKNKKLKKLGNPNVFNLKDVSSSSSYSVAQAGCETDKYKIICFRRPDGNKDGKVRIKVIDKKTGKTVKQVDNLPLDHANGMTYNENTGTIYVTNCGEGSDAKKISYFSLNDLLNGGGVNIKTKKVKINGEAINVSAISYDNATNTMYVGAGDTIYALDHLGNATKISKIQSGVPQDIYANNGYLYVVRYNPNGKDSAVGINTISSKQENASQNIIDVYKNGKYVGSKTLKTGGENYELESLSYSGKGNKFTLYFNHKGTTNGSIGSVNISVPC